MFEKYYIIKQEIPYVETNIIKIECPSNHKHIKQLISLMFGQISVYIYNSNDNTRKDLTKKYNLDKDFNIYDYSFIMPLKI